MTLQLGESWTHYTVLKKDWEFQSVTKSKSVDGLDVQPITLSKLLRRVPQISFVNLQSLTEFWGQNILRCQRPLRVSHIFVVQQQSLDINWLVSGLPIPMSSAAPFRRGGHGLQFIWQRIYNPDVTWLVINQRMNLLYRGLLSNMTECQVCIL